MFFFLQGLFVFGGVTNFCVNATGFDEKFPGITTHFLVLNGQFKFPLYREYLIAAGFGSPNAESIDYKLTKCGPGHSVWLAIGGAAEVLMIEKEKYNLKIKNRKGFIRRALKTGFVFLFVCCFTLCCACSACIVPVFSFGETMLYDVQYPKPGTFYALVAKLAKFFCSLDLPVDVRGQFRHSWFMIPKKHPVNTVVGAPIDFCKLKNHTPGKEAPPEVVDECHQMYLDALRKLYDEHKAKYGDEKKPLVFM